MNTKKSAVALGLFDGVHLGHRAVLKMAVESGFVPSVFTFNPETVAVKSSAGYIYNKEEKDRLLAGCGIEQIYSVDFSDVCGLNGEEFVKNILIDRLNAGFVCCGNDFRFGKNASCGVAELRELGRKYGFDFASADDIKWENVTVSSTEIREFLLDGDVVKAHMFLGSPYTVSCEVVHGAELGRTIGFPTINQVFGKGQLVPKYGVYASNVCIDGSDYRAMTNIGMKPTVNYGGMPLAETHIIGFSGDLYGRRISTEIMEFVRPEQKFASVDELKREIAEDMEEIQNILM
ncbi:MAG: riboflavin biosynthesis protein RibF [Ruminococcus flavefaciens]|nr:riboflavin biosynthesis protein RibF [Ruminococcus flavefaciens]MCM1228941.1 riboflavin biosynthesis protein RibF [Ruminococcus flavefaciens]